MKKNSQNFIQNQAKQLAEYKQTLDSEHELLLPKNRDTEKSLIDLQQKVLSLTTSLDQEKANRQKLQVELALANERLTKQAEELVIHKNQYEGRLKNAHEDKDTLIVKINNNKMRLNCCKKK